MRLVPGIQRSGLLVSLKVPALVRKHQRHLIQCHHQIRPAARQVQLQQINRCHLNRVQMNQAMINQLQIRK